MKPQNNDKIKFDIPYKRLLSQKAQKLLKAIELSQAADDSLWKELAITLLDDMKKIIMINSIALKRYDDMKYEEDFECYNLISQMADEYPELDVLLESYALTYEKALQRANEWKMSLNVCWKS